MKKTSPPTVKFCLSAILRERGLSQRKTATITGISKNGISVLCGEPTQVKFETIGKLCHTLKLSPADLFELAVV